MCTEIKFYIKGEEKNKDRLEVEVTLQGCDVCIIESLMSVMASDPRIAQLIIAQHNNINFMHKNRHDKINFKII